MYRTCIFCSAALGANEAVEAFPVGRTLAFDAWKGRLWAVCPRCGRWNLAPLEERWEAVESAEKRFRDSRLRAQSENIGLARLPDGTRLVRVGKALPRELAAWRYGEQLRRRRTRHLWILGAGAVAGAAWTGLAFAGVLGGAGGLLGLGSMYWQHRQGQRMVHLVPAHESPTGAPFALRRHQLNGASLLPAGTGEEMRLHLPQGLDASRARTEDGRNAWLPARALVLRGVTARTVLSRAMVDANSRGASRSRLDQAFHLLSGAGEAEAYLKRVAARRATLGLAPLPNYRLELGWSRFVGTFRGERVPAAPSMMFGALQKDRLPAAEALALEMALHEETERRALQGELAELEAAWREAEEIAAIADALPDDPPPPTLPVS